MFISFLQRKETNQRNAARVQEGLENSVMKRKYIKNRCPNFLHIILPRDPQPSAVGILTYNLQNSNYLKSKKLSLRERSASLTI